MQDLLKELNCKICSGLFCFIWFLNFDETYRQQIKLIHSTAWNYSTMFFKSKRATNNVTWWRKVVCKFLQNGWNKNKKLYTCLDQLQLFYFSTREILYIFVDKSTSVSKTTDKAKNGKTPAPVLFHSLLMCVCYFSIIIIHIYFFRRGEMIFIDDKATRKKKKRTRIIFINIWLAFIHFYGKLRQLSINI